MLEVSAGADSKETREELAGRSDGLHQLADFLQNGGFGFKREIDFQVKPHGFVEASVGLGSRGIDWSARLSLFPDDRLDQVQLCGPLGHAECLNGTRLRLAESASLSDHLVLATRDSLERVSSGSEVQHQRVLQRIDQGVSEDDPQQLGRDFAREESEQGTLPSHGHRLLSLHRFDARIFDALEKWRHSLFESFVKSQEEWKHKGLVGLGADFGSIHPRERVSSGYSAGWATSDSRTGFRG